MKLAAGYAPEPAQQVGLHPDLFCSANDLPALGVSDFESPFAYGTGDGFFTPNEKYSIHRCRSFRNVILLSYFWDTTLRKSILPERVCSVVAFLFHLNAS